MATVLDLIYNPTSQLPYQDRMLVPVAAPSIFGAIQQVQQLAAQRAEADAIGRQSLAAALRQQQLLAAQRAAQQQQLAALNALAAMEAAERQRQFEAEQQYRKQALDYGLKRDLLSELDKRQREIKQQALTAEKEAADLAVGVLEEAENQAKQAAASRLSALQSIVNQKNPLPYLDTIPQLFEEIAATTEDRSPLKSYAAHLKAQLDEFNRLYDSVSNSANEANLILAQELQRQIEPIGPKAIAEQIWLNMSPEQRATVGANKSQAIQKLRNDLQRAMETRHIPDLVRFLELAGLGVSVTAAKQEALRRVKATLDDQARRFLQLGPAGFEPGLAKPPSPSIVDEWVESALQIKPLVPSKPLSEKYKIAKEASEKASSPFLKELEKLQNMRRMIMAEETRPRESMRQPSALQSLSPTR